MLKNCLDGNSAGFIAISFGSVWQHVVAYVVRFPPGFDYGSCGMGYGTQRPIYESHLPDLAYAPESFVFELPVGGEDDQVLTISIKPFMDAWTYDQDRIDACCVHILDPEGNPVSFCEYNAVNRPRMGAA